jgi:hypothetical protein
VPNVNLRRLSKKSPKRDAKNPQPGAELQYLQLKVEESLVEDSPVGDSPVEDSPVDGGSPVDESLVEESLVEDSPVEDSPVEDSPVEGSPVDGSPVEDNPVEDSPVEDSLVEKSLVEQSLVEQSLVEESLVEQSLVEQSLVEESLVEESPVEESPVEESPVEESLVENAVLFKTSEVTKECPTPLIPPPLPGKKGIGLKLDDEEKNKNMPKVVALNPYWNYSWGSKRVESQPDNIEFVPMLWGAWGDTGLVNRIVADVIPQIESGQAKRVLAFNEPDRPKQLNMSVEDVVSYWHILEDIDLPLASRSVARSTGSWMIDFMEEAEADCLRMEYVAIHWYGGASVEEFKNKMRVTYEMYGSRRPLLLTEFAPADWTALTPADNKWSQANVLAFMKEVLPWLEEQDWIEGYAWFSFEQSFAAGTSSALFDLNGDQTTIGKFYASVTTDNPAGDQSITV